MRWITVQAVERIHTEVIRSTGGLPGVRDRGLLRSAVMNPLATFGGKDLYPDLLAKVAALLFGLVKNHPFVDGNKRTAFVVSAVVLKLAVAAGCLGYNDILLWLRRHTE